MDRVFLFVETPHEDCVDNVSAITGRDMARYRLRSSRQHGDSANVKTMIFSPVTVLMSWCKRTTVTPVQTAIIFSKLDRAASTN